MSIGKESHCSGLGAVLRRTAAASMIALAIASCVYAQEPDSSQESVQDSTAAVEEVATPDSKDAEKPAEGQSNEAVAEESRPAPFPRIPATLPDGRKIRTIGIYQSQMDVLIPDHYYPVSIDQFIQALERSSDRATDNQTSRLKGAVYWIDVQGDTLVSDRSVIDIETDRGVQVRRSLGKVNLAIEQPYNRGSTSVTQLLPRLESEPDGNLVAVFRADDNAPSGIEFKWQLRGRPLGNGHEFNLRLPPTPQTRIVLSAPQDISVETVDGVLHQRPGPPPDATQLAEDRTWYEIDAGGLDQVRIRTAPSGPAPEGASFVVRQSSIQYRADPSGLHWTCRMLVQPPADHPFPDLTLTDTTLTSAKVNATEVSFRKQVDSGQTHWQLEVPRGVVDSQAVLANIVLTGHTVWQQPQSDCELAMPQWHGDNVVHASTFDQVELAVTEPLQLTSWHLPESWRQTPLQPRDDGVSIYSATGPPVALLRNPTESATSESSAAKGNEDQTHSSWSRVRFISQPFVNRSQTDLRLEFNGGAFAATSRIALQIDPRSIEPLKLRIQRGWSVETVTFEASGRVIETPAIPDNNRLITLWPEAEDVEDSRIELEVAGTRLLPGNGGDITLPSTWFARIEQGRGTLVAALLRPANLNWSGEAAMKCLPGPPPLSPSQETFFAAADEDTLWLQPETGRTPPITLQTPTVAYNAESLFHVVREGSDLVERLVIEVDSQSQTLQELSVQTGPSLGRPEFSWSITGIGDGPATSVPGSDVTVGTGESDGVYTMDVSDKVLRGRRLVGRRRYPLQSQIAMQLPSVPGATSQRSEVYLGPGLLLQSKSRAVQQVPGVRTNETTDSTFASLRHQVSGDADAMRHQATRLRYDAVEQPSITLQVSDATPEVTMVWQEQVRVIASSRGSDLIEATYHVSPAAPFEIDYSLDLQLTSIRRDGIPVDLSSIKQRPIVLAPRTQSEIIRVRWTRSEYQSGWIRHCKIPRISASGTVLRSQYQLVPASDSFAPVALLRNQRSRDDGMTEVTSRPGEVAILLRRNIALALGWMIAMLVFAAAWYVAEHWPLIIVVAVAVATTVLFLWWPWRLAVIGWFIVPMLAAGMLAASRLWSQHKDRFSWTRQIASDEHPAPSSVKELGSDLAAPGLSRLLLWLCVVSVPLVTAVAQGDGENKTTRQAGGVNVLMPVTSEGEPSSEMIYISRKLRSELFPSTAARKPEDARFQSAKYDVRLEAEINGEDPGSAVALEAEYVIHLDKGQRGARLVRLPLPVTAVRRIESLDDNNRLVQFVPDASGDVIATLPEGNTFRIRATLIPAISQSDQRTKLFLPIPPVAATRLTVESETNIESLRVGGAGGALLRETDLRRWVEALGPVDSLEIDFRSGSKSSDEVAPLQRRYWVRANGQQVTIDCEVDPPHSVAAGETFQFIIRDSRLPQMTASGWRLERSEQYSPTRRLMTVTSRRDSPGPVRLLWTEPVTVDENDPEEPQSIRIPEVIAAALGENAPAWIALYSEPVVRFLPLSRESTEPLAVDHFLAAWSGYRGGIDLAMVALDEMPAPVIERRQTQSPVVQQQHDLRVAADRLELHYAATLLPNQPEARRYALRFPLAMRLSRVSINGETIDQQPVRYQRHQELLLGHLAGDQPISLQVVATQGLQARNAERTFAPPALELVPRVPTSATYAISHAPDAQLREIETPSTVASPLGLATTSELLVRGWIPHGVWDVSTSEGQPSVDSPGGKFAVRSRSTQFDTSQLIVLERDSGQWTMDVSVRFRSGMIPDFVDVEVPAAWCDNLEIAPAGALLARRDATDKSRQVLRIACRLEQTKSPSISIRGRLQNSETGRVNAPVVKVLGRGNRQIFIDLPAELDQDPIRWRTSAVEAVRMPRLWQRAKVSGPRATYVVASPSWSIELAPIPEDDAGAIAVAADAQIFPQDDSTLVLCHWDLYPGSLESVRLRMPQDAKCVGVWTAGRAGVATTLPADEGSTHQVLSVPLALDRLSQPVEVLLRVPASTSRTGDYLPELMDITVPPRWLVHYAAVTSANDAVAAPAGVREDRALAMAQGVVEAIAAVNRVTQRPRDEVAAWLQLWVMRYRMIARSVNRNVQLDGVPEMMMLPGDDKEPALLESGGRSLPRHLRWKQLDAELNYHLGRLLPADSSREAGNTTLDVATEGTENLKDHLGSLFLFDVAGYQGFTPLRVTRLTASSRPEPIQPVSPDYQGLRVFIINLLTLLLVSGLLISLRPLRRYFFPIVVHPAFWLALIGLFGFAVAPIAVASAILLVALALPAFPGRKRASTG